MSKPSLKALALAPMAGFRKKEVSVPEWDNAKVIIREPSERAFRTMRADVTLFIDILLDTDLQPVFTVDDTEQVEAIYGPVHSRLLKQALDLIRDADDAKAK